MCTLLDDSRPREEALFMAASKIIVSVSMRAAKRALALIGWPFPACGEQQTSLIIQLRRPVLILCRRRTPPVHHCSPGARGLRRSTMNLWGTKTYLAVEGRWTSLS
jgi:hypothetical protein